MKPDVLTLLKALQLSLENGKSLANALTLLQNTAKKKDERIAYINISRSIQEGVPFSKAMEKYLSPSHDIIQFVAMAEKGGNFVKTLKSVVNYLEIKTRFHQESNDKIALPLIYFSLTTIVIIYIHFYSIPFYLKEASTYSEEIQAVITDHLHTAQILSDVLLGLLFLLASYFFTVMIALFKNTGIIQNFAKRFASQLPVSSYIMNYFEKFMLLSLLSEMLKNGVSLKTAFQTAANSTMLPKISQQFNLTLERLSRGEKNFWEISFFTDIEHHLLVGAGNVFQVGEMLGQFAENSRINAISTTTRFFRLITILAILLLAFGVFVEFFTVVLTQLLIQQEFIHAAEHA